MANYRVDTRTLNALLTTTLDSYSTEMADTIFSSNYLYYMLKKKGCFKSQDGGAYMRKPVMFQVNSTAAWYSGYDTIDVTPQDGMTDGIYPWASLAASISISREEERKNSGKSRLINLLDKKIMQCEESMIEKLNDGLCGEGKYNISQTTKQMAGLLSLIPEVPASFDAGGLDGDNTWWQNKVRGNAASTFVWTYDLGDTPVEPTGIAAMRTLYNNCKKGAGGAPDIIVTNQYAIEKYEGGLTPQRRFSDDSVASAGFDNVKFRSALMSWDEDICSASVTAAQGVDTYAVMYMINSKYFEIMYDSQSLFAHEGFVRPENQLARSSLVVFMGNAMITNRRKCGVLVDANITNIN